MTQKHEFALHVPELKKYCTQEACVLTDPALVQRMTGVLRLQPEETCILFDAFEHARCRITTIHKKSINLEILSYQKNTILQPHITCFLPLLKRDDLEAALYAAVELGANSVQLVLTEKVQRSWGGAKEYERLQRVMIAAAEQSKNFAIPELYAPRALTEVVQELRSSVKIFFDMGGVSVLKLMTDVSEQKPKEVAILVGPESDLTPAEKAFLLQHNFTTCELTPTVLRAVSAYTLGLGLLRSSLH
jgi:16S rRNA (uracil1498-N3)-methyltransferase